MSEAIDLLVVDDDAEFRSVMAKRLAKRGYQVQEAGDGLDALELAHRREFDVAIVDMNMPQLSGLELIGQLRALQPECEVIVLTGEASVENCVQAMKAGAYYYLRKPSSLAELEALVEKATNRRHLVKENQQLKHLLNQRPGKCEMIGESSAIKEVWRLIERAGPTDKAILIQGESGTGKELVAAALHRTSARADRPLVTINCAALPETLLESELFGHEKGAFTGAVNAKPGFFEVADGGTLFIDEIGEMPPALQAKLLRVLEDGSMRRIGSVKERRVSVRLLAATNRDMAAEVKAGRFREDLYYRINVMSLNLPPLRHRVGDIPLLVKHFVGADWTIEPEALKALERHPWPGNIRQLINAIERAKILADDWQITLKDLPDEVADNKDSPSVTGVDDLGEVERSHVLEVLKRERGNKARTARALRLNRRSLYRLLEKYGLHVTEQLPVEKSG
ncbi:MAG: sigma-54-dependent Fis family transcriptional regulator [Planctomycetes bacterium]|nr:sigma-54-dependent Fis family transcriptional regulator [Planctomycetota bacterium]